MLTNNVTKLLSGKILILGFAREGQSTYRFIRRYFPNSIIGIADKNQDIQKEFKKEKNVSWHLGENYLKFLTDYDIVIKTPGIPNRFPEIKDARKKVKFTTQTEIFFNLVRGTIVGITGTKGKSTTSALINHILTTDGKKSVLIGNIGKPCLDYLDNDSKDTYFVFELSSFQLQDLRSSPHVSVFLNIFREHQDIHGSEREYFEAKSKITLFQKSSDYFIYNSEFAQIKRLANKTKAKTLSFSFYVKDDNAYMDSGELVIQTEKGKARYERARLNKLFGMHNLYNKMAAVLAATSLRVKKKSIEKALDTFQPLEYRLEFIKSDLKIEFVNDSLSTIPEAALAAVSTFVDVPKTIILGGKDRGQSFDMLAGKLATNKTVIAVIAIGELAPGIVSSLKKNKYRGKVINLGSSDMTKIVREAVSVTPDDGFVILSPGASSFDMFKDYRERGDKFKEAVMKLKQK